MAKMKSDKFVDKCIEIAKEYKTLYVLGCFGAPMNEKNKARYSQNNSFNRKRRSMIYKASADTFGFDCVCLIKGILWGWYGNKGANYGGAAYCSNGVPDFGSDGIMDYCSGVSRDFKNIVHGEVVHMPGHVGVYIGNGLAVECSPKWANKVQITAVANIGQKSGYNARKWVDHGKLRYIEYVSEAPKTTPKAEDKPKLRVDGSFGPATAKRTQEFFCTTKYGVISSQPRANKKFWSCDGGAFQWRTVGTGSDVIKAWSGYLERHGFGKQTKTAGKAFVIALQGFLKKEGLYKGEIDGSAGFATCKAWQTFLNNH